MQKASFMKRFVVPVAIVLITMVASSLLYHNLWKIGDPILHRILAHLFAPLLFISIGFGAVLIYPMAYFRGASATERIIACLITPVVWNVSEMVRVSEFFTFGETLYYGFNTAFLLALFGTFGLMGLCELICRWRLNKEREEPVKVLSPAPVVSIVAALAALYLFLIWGLGVHFFYIYVEGYKAIFT
jgi:hypothetical protein